MSKKFLIPVGAAVTALVSQNSSAAIALANNGETVSGVSTSQANLDSANKSSLQSVGYVKDGEAHSLMMKKMDSGLVLSYHSSHASHASHSSHRSGR
ncbi:MAG: hypothetical protein RL744_282 [Pseudomonadota bacterium]|jgi:hypothetical protein